jgi:hypothetical protein
VVYTSFINDAASVAVDACTVNNVLNVLQLAVLIALLRWVRGPGKPPA